MSDDVYDMDLSKVQGALDSLHGLGDRAKALKGKFLADHERYRGWNGDSAHPDDYQRKTEPDDEGTTLTLTETIDSFELAISAVESALLESLGSVKAVQADVHELIEQQKRMADEHSGDDGSSGGKH